MRSHLNIIFIILLLLSPFQSTSVKLSSSGFLDTTQAKIDETYKILTKVLENFPKTPLKSFLLDRNHAFRKENPRYCDFAIEK